MPNLLEHTLDVLKHNNRSMADIKYCKTSNGWFAVKDFISLADVTFNRIGALVNPELQVIGKDFIMYWTINGDDQEWWFMELLPDKPDDYYKPISLLAA